MIWPFKRDPLESDADLLVGAVNNFDEFAFISHDERGLRYWKSQKSEGTGSNLVVELGPSKKPGCSRICGIERPIGKAEYRRQGSSDDIAG